MPIERKKTLNVFKDARDAWGSYDDFPVGQPGIAAGIVQDASARTCARCARVHPPAELGDLAWAATAAAICASLG